MLTRRYGVALGIALRWLRRPTIPPAAGEVANIRLEAGAQ
jgi:hypothetical protein